jgi:hypothetical protein
MLRFLFCILVFLSLFGYVMGQQQPPTPEQVQQSIDVTVAQQLDAVKQLQNIPGLYRQLQAAVTENQRLRHELDSLRAAKAKK